MSSEHLPVTGGCLCSAVRYESKNPPTTGFYCHCHICQKHFGGLFGAYLKFSKAGLLYPKGQPTYYRSSEIARRGFCSACGSPMIFVYDGAPDVWISIGSVDHPEDWPLVRDASWGRVTHGRVDRKVPWYEIHDGLPQLTSENSPLRREAEVALGRERN